MTDHQTHLARQIRVSLDQAKSYAEFRPSLVALVDSGVLKEDLNAALTDLFVKATLDTEADMLTDALDALIDHGWGLSHTKLYPVN